MSEKATRIPAIDMMRGFVIVLMALDHVRDYFHTRGFDFDPLDAAQTTPWLYATRWITLHGWLASCCAMCDVTTDRHMMWRSRPIDSSPRARARVRDAVFGQVVL